MHAKYEKPAEGEAPTKPKSFIHWVGESAAHNSPIRAEVRAFNSLFKSEDPSAHPAGMRVAYFAVDRESTDEKLVLNRIVTLKDTQGKN